MRSNMTTIAIGFLCVFQLGWLWATLLLPEASAQEGHATSPQPASFHQICRGFTAPLDDQMAAVDTRDRLTEVGQWVGQHEDQGLRLHHVDFEIGQKRTGYPQGWIYVCMAPTSSPAQIQTPD